MTVGRTSLDEGSVRRRDIYLTNIQETDIHAPHGIFLIPLYSVLHPYLVLCLDCPAFCLCLQHTTQIFLSCLDFFVFVCSLYFMRTSFPDCPGFVPFVLTVQHTQHEHPCPRQDSKPQRQQAIGLRSTPQTARPLGSAHAG